MWKSVRSPNVIAGDSASKLPQSRISEDETGVISGGVRLGAKLPLVYLKLSGLFPDDAKYHIGI